MSLKVWVRLNSWVIESPLCKRTFILVVGFVVSTSNLTSLFICNPILVLTDPVIEDPCPLNAWNFFSTIGAL